MYAFVDLGSETPDCTQEVRISVNDHFKTPVAHYLINGLAALEKLI